MITITFTIDGGKFSQTNVHLDNSSPIDPSEITAFWKIFGNGGFEKDAKRLLERLCADQRLDAAKLLAGG